MGKAYFMHGAQYVRYDMGGDTGGDKVDGSCPEALDIGWSELDGTGFEQDIDVALDLGNGKLNLFKGDSYLRVDNATNIVEAQALIADDWPGMADNGFADALDAAVNWGKPAWVQPLPARTLTVSRPDATHVHVTLSGVVSWMREFPGSPPTEVTGDQLGADSPTGDDVVRATRLQQSRTVRASVQFRPAGAGDLDWASFYPSLLLALSVEESGGYRATWTGSVNLPPDAGTPEGDAAGHPGLRRPGGTGSSWRVLVEEHELLDADPVRQAGAAEWMPRLVYADSVSL